MKFIFELNQDNGGGAVDLDEVVMIRQPYKFMDEWIIEVGFPGYHADFYYDSEEKAKEEYCNLEQKYLNIPIGLYNRTKTL